MRLFLAIIVSILLVIGGCQKAAEAPGSAANTFEVTRPTSPEQARIHKILSEMTNAIVEAMALRDFERLGQYVENQMTGLQIAQRFLGKSMFTVNIIRWEGRMIDIRLDETNVVAVVKIPVRHSAGPNRKQFTTIFTFNFHYSTQRKQWFLTLD